MDNNRDETVVVQERDTETRTSSTGPIVAIITIAVLALLALLVYNLLRGADDTTDTDTTNTTTTTEINSPVEEGVELTNPNPGATGTETVE